VSLDGLVNISGDVAAILLSTHSGASLSVRWLEEASPRAIACLRDNPGIDLGRRWASAGIRRSSNDTKTLLATITQIAGAAEEALRRGERRR
jgi:hypothetical protein